MKRQRKKILGWLYSMKKIVFSVNEFHLTREVHLRCFLPFILLEKGDRDWENFFNFILFLGPI
jgi:hypothetical protein